MFDRATLHAGRAKPQSVEFTLEERTRIQVAQQRIRNQVQVGCMPFVLMFDAYVFHHLCALLFSSMTGLAHIWCTGVYTQWLQIFRPYWLQSTDSVE